MVNDVKRGNLVSLTGKRQAFSVGLSHCGREMVEQEEANALL
jgi:hypothetical protein